MSFVKYIEHVILDIAGTEVLYFELEVVEKTLISQWRSGRRKSIFPVSSLEVFPWEGEPPTYRADIIRHLAESVIEAFRIQGFDDVVAGTKPGKAFVFQLHKPSGSVWGHGCTDLDPATSLLVVNVPGRSSPHLNDALEQAWKYAIPLKDLLL